jgi:hypothetical protein
VQQVGNNPWVGLVAVGFSPADRLSAIARRIGWEGAVLSDPGRQLYSRLGIGRARWWRIYTPGTLALYARALIKKEQISRPEEDTRQLGGDAVMVAGRVTTLWRPASPNGRPDPAEVIAAADAAVEAQR